MTAPASILRDSSAANIAQAAALLETGRLVAFPTETVYGLGANASDRSAVARIFAAKGRPTHHPLIVHLGSVELLDRWAQGIPSVAWRLAERFWPGPLTLILPRSRGVLDAVTGGQDTVGLRVPGHPVALALLKAFGAGVAAPSANRFGRVSPTTSAHVLAELGDRIDCVIDGGPCTVGLESTILDLSSTRPRLLRPGAITAAALAEALGEPPTIAGAEGPRAPGRLPTHYAPSAPLRVLERAALEAAIDASRLPAHAVAVLATREPSTDLAALCRWQRLPSNARGYGQALYASLRAADTPECRLILVERPPPQAEWDAVNDRLARAAAATEERSVA